MGQTGEDACGKGLETGADRLDFGSKLVVHVARLGGRWTDGADGEKGSGLGGLGRYTGVDDCFDAAGGFAGCVDLIGLVVVLQGDLAWLADGGDGED